MQSILYFVVFAEKVPEMGGSSCCLEAKAYPSHLSRERESGLCFEAVKFDCSLQDYRALNGAYVAPVPVGDTKFVDAFYEEWRKG